MRICSTVRLKRAVRIEFRTLTSTRLAVSAVFSKEIRSAELDRRDRVVHGRMPR